MLFYACRFSVWAEHIHTHSEKKFELGKGNNLDHPFECITWHFLHISDDWILFAFVMSFYLHLPALLCMPARLRTKAICLQFGTLWISKMFAIICMQTNCTKCTHKTHKALTHRHIRVMHIQQSCTHTPTPRLRPQSACNDTLLIFFKSIFSQSNAFLPYGILVVRNAWLKLENRPKRIWTFS